MVVASRRGRSKMRNPYTGKMIYANGAASRHVKESRSKSAYYKEKRPYTGLKTSDFCQPSDRKFPVTTEKKCRAALSYSRWAKNPSAVKACALRKAKEHGWRCGVTYKKGGGARKRSRSRSRRRRSISRRR